MNENNLGEKKVSLQDIFNAGKQQLIENNKSEKNNTTIDMDEDLKNVNLEDSKKFFNELNEQQVKETQEKLNNIEKNINKQTENITKNKNDMPNVMNIVKEDTAKNENNLNEKDNENKNDINNNAVLMKKIKDKINLDSIYINKDYVPLKINKNVDKLVAIKPSTQVLLLQSGYSAELTALNNHELRSMITNNIDYRSLKEKAYTIIYKHIQNSSIGSMTFQQFLEITSFLDEPTLFYGLFDMTFTGDNKYTIYCTNPGCQAYTNGFEVKVNNKNLIKSVGDEMKLYEQRDNLIEQKFDAADLVQHSLVHHTKRVLLKESTFVVDIRIPSLHDYLHEALFNKNPKFAAEYMQELGTALFIEQFLIPDIIGWNGNDVEKLEWLPITDVDKRIEYLCKLSMNDFDQLIKEIDTFYNMYRLEYAIQNVVCPICGRKLGDVNIAMDDLLFHLTNVGQQ